jgi:predicted O-linked N-acetylglucosamine transferase (SPINDLY family)
MSEANHLEVLAAEIFNAGNAAFKKEQWEEALAACDKALQHHAGFIQAHLLKARCLVRLGRWMPAREAFAQTLRLDPSNYSAWLEAGHLCKEMGELGQAAASYQRAIHVAPKRHEAYLGMSRVMALQGQHDLADLAYNDAVQAALAHSDDAAFQVHWMMGQYVLEMGHTEQSIRCFANALATLKNINSEVSINKAAEVQMDWARALLRLGQRDAAIKLLTVASGATQESTLSRLAMLSFRNNFWQEAIEVSRRCVALYPQSAWAHWNLAHLLAECWQMEEAELVLQKAEALAPMPGARSLRGAVAGKVGDADAALALYTELAREEGVGSTYASSAAMSSLYSDALSAQAVADLHRELFEPWGKGARARESFVRKPREGRRLKLGIVSADFHHQHPVNIFMQPVLRELDISQFELFMYFVGDSHDEQTALARTRVEHWVEVGTLNTTQLAKRIDADEIDVLLDMAGHTSQHRMQLFAQRAAPVQMTYLGYPGSTGVPNMDYLLGDVIVTPEGCESLYTEQVLRLPGTVFCFAPEDDYPSPKFDAAVAKRSLTFGSFNNVPKLTPHTLKLWARVLAEVPDSRLVLKAPSFSDEAAKRIFAERLEALGVDLSRVEFRGPVGLTDMMAEYADIDIALDPVPYNGGTTSLQAMWMGVPVLTQMGAHFVSRMGASFMTAAGLPEWVAKDDDDYVAIAKKMASDRKALLSLKKGLRKQLQKNQAWDVVLHTRALEAAWRTV